MKRNIYLSCEKEKRQYFKNKIKEYTGNIMIVDNMSEADTCLCIGHPDELMEEDIIIAQESGVEIKTMNENLINTGIYKSVLSGMVRPQKAVRKNKLKEL